MPFSSSAIFLLLFYLFHISKMFPSEDFVIMGNKKKLLGVRSSE